MSANIRESNGTEFWTELFRCLILHAEIPHIPTGDLYDLRDEMRLAGEWMSERLMDIEQELSERNTEDTGGD